MKHPDQAPFAHGCGEPARAELDLDALMVIAESVRDNASSISQLVAASTIDNLISELRAARTMLDDFLTDDAEEKAMQAAWAADQLAAVKAILDGTEPDTEVMAHSETARKVLALRESQRELLQEIYDWLVAPGDLDGDAMDAIYNKHEALARAKETNK